MLVISENAKQRLHKSLRGRDKPEVRDKCFRIVPTAHEHFLTLQVAEPETDDTTFEYNGRTVLALPKALRRICWDKQLRINSEGRLILS